MDYIIIEEENLGLVDIVECGDLLAVTREVLAKLKNGRTPRVFLEVPYDVNVIVKEIVKDETVTRKAKSNKDTGGPGDGKVRRGDKGTPPAVGEGSGDTGSGSDTEN